MDYAVEVIVNLPRHKTLGLLWDRRNDQFWRPDLLLCESMSVEPSAQGAVTRLLYGVVADGVREVVETVTWARLPDAAELTLHSSKADERQAHTFVEQNGSTRWNVRSTIVFAHPQLVRSREVRLLQQSTLQEMESFKRFAEKFR